MRGDHQVNPLPSFKSILASTHTHTHTRLLTFCYGVLQELNLGSVVAIAHPSLQDLEPSASYRTQDTPAIREVLQLVDLQHAPVFRKSGERLK